MEYKVNTHWFINRGDFPKRSIERYTEGRIICITSKFKLNNIAK